MSGRHVSAYDLMGTATSYTLLTINVHDHELVKTPAKAATTSSEGSIECYRCTASGKILKEKAVDTILHGMIIVKSV